jgi:oligopeptide transport system permease protein
MVKYIIKRILLGVLTLFIVATATFFLMRAIPGGPFLAEKAPSAATLAALNAKYGMDKPLFEQYTTYLVGAVHGDLGPSIKQRGRQVSDIIKARFPISFRIGGLAVLFALFVGIPLGVVAAVKRGKAADKVISIFCAAGMSIPNFVTSTLLMYILGVVLHWLPTRGLDTPGSYIMPVIALGMSPMSAVARLTRSSLLDVLGQDYMRTAKAKGLSRFKTIFKHALRNALTPVVTYVGSNLAFYVTGSMVVEKIFTIPGLGNAFVSSILNRDYTLVMGTTIFLATFIIAMNVVVDILYKLLDPRVELS